MKGYTIGALTAVMLILQFTDVDLAERLAPDPQVCARIMGHVREQEARVLWEQAIAAKGGIDKLQSVQNMFISSRAEYTTHQGKRNSTKEEELLVFPDKQWLWTDMRPDVFGLRVEMYNYEARTFYILAPDDSDKEIHQLADYKKWEESPLLITQVLYFMETSWVKPVPIAVRRGEVRKHTVDIVQTQVNGKRVDFALDPITHLPVRCIFYKTSNGLDVPIVVTDVSNYVDILGISVPQQLTPEGGSTYFDNIRINVKYNEDIFAKPTTIEAGPEAWKPMAEK